MMTDNLPEELDRYFSVNDDSFDIEICRLVPTRSRERGIENAARFMREAYDGKRMKRRPILVCPTDAGDLEIVDGNSTYAVAVAAGWSKIRAKMCCNQCPRNNP